MKTTLVTLLVLPFLLLESALGALRNISIDDTSFMIQYSGRGWGEIHTSGLNYGGSHQTGEDPSSLATFTFTGVAVYYISPLWPYAVNSALRLDSRSQTNVDLVDHNATPTDGGSESAISIVTWSRTNLENKEHKVYVSAATVNGKYTVVDGFIYTVFETDPSSSKAGLSPTSATSSELPSSSASEPSNSNSTNGPSKSRITAIAVGVAIGGFALIVALLIIFFFCRRQKRREQQSVQHDKIEAFDSPYAPSFPPAFMPAPIVTRPVEFVDPRTLHGSGSALGSYSNPTPSISSSTGPLFAGGNVYHPYGNGQQRTAGNSNTLSPVSETSVTSLPQQLNPNGTLRPYSAAYVPPMQRFSGSEHNTMIATPPGHSPGPAAPQNYFEPQAEEFNPYAQHEPSTTSFGSSSRGPGHVGVQNVLVQNEKDFMRSEKQFNPIRNPTPAPPAYS